MRVTSEYGLVLICLAMSLIWPSSAAAYTITVDGDPSDWLLQAPTNVNTGHIARDATYMGEFIWTDQVGDERPDFGGAGVPPADPLVDITEVRITADDTNLYVLVRMDDIDLAYGDGAPQVQIAIDTDYTVGSGQQWLAAWSMTQTAPEAAWEYLIMTRFGSSDASSTYSPTVYEGFFNPTNTGEAAISVTDDAIEISVPWSDIGGDPDVPLQMTVVSLRSDDSDQAWDTGSLWDSDVLDAVTNYGDPGPIAADEDTALEVSDDMVDYHFQVWFHLDPDQDPSPPLVISEVLYDAVADPEGEWYEIYNRTGIDGVPLSSGGLAVMISDEETVDGSEGTFAFPDGTTIDVDDVVLIANEATSYAAEHVPPHPQPDVEINDTSATVPDMLRDDLWSSDTDITLHNAGDDLLLLDPFYTVIDAVSWNAGGGYPGLTAHDDVDEGHSIERPISLEDSDDSQVDMVDHLPAEITPGVAFDLLSLGATCTDPNECLSGFCVDGVCCDRLCDGVCDRSCNAGGHCQYEPASTVCRPADGDCDSEERCTSGSSDCPTDGFLVDTDVCRPADGICDVDDYCPGTGPDCSADSFSPDTVMCRPSDDVCDADDYCSGSGPACPADGFLPDTTLCRLSTDDCDADDYCSGSGPACPADGFLPNTVICRPSTDDCDADDYCSGSGTACPADEFLSASTICRPAADDCDADDYCSGSGPACRADALLPDTAVCRAVAGDCDVAELCSGTSMACPADTFRPASVECRPVAGICDVAELCSGSAAACPADGFISVGVECRASIDQCDALEACTGAAASCPVDDPSSMDGEPCDDENEWTIDEVCWSGVCGGDEVGSCELPIAVLITPYSEYNSTAARPSHISDYGADCAGLGENDNADVIYSIEVEAGETVVVTLEGSSVFDGAIAVIADCEDAQDCLEASDGTGLGGIEEVLFIAEEDGTYYVVVEGLRFEEEYTVSFDLVSADGDGDADADSDGDVDADGDIEADGDVDSDGDIDASGDADADSDTYYGGSGGGGCQCGVSAGPADAAPTILLMTLSLLLILAPIRKW